MGLGNAGCDAVWLDQWPSQSAAATCREDKQKKYDSEDDDRQKGGEAGQGRGWGSRQQFKAEEMTAPIRMGHGAQLCAWLAPWALLKAAHLLNRLGVSALQPRIGPGGQKLQLSTASSLLGLVG